MRAARSGSGLGEGSSPTLCPERCRDSPRVGRSAGGAATAPRWGSFGSLVRTGREATLGGVICLPGDTLPPRTAVLWGPLVSFGASQPFGGEAAGEGRVCGRAEMWLRGAACSEGGLSRGSRGRLPGGRRLEGLRGSPEPPACGSRGCGL